MTTEFIPIPPDFPVKWEETGDECLFWQLEPHFPKPVTPLDYHINARIPFVGFNKALKAFHFPLEARTRYINTCYYVSYVYDNEGMEAKVKASMEKLDIAMTTMMASWKNEWLPEIMTHLDYWESFDLTGVSMPALLKHLDETEKRVDRCWEIHFLLYLPMLLAPHLFGEMYHDLFPDSGPFEALELLAGFENANVESSRALWDLSRQALASPAVYKVLAENDAATVLPRLRDSAQGRSFVAELDKYLEKYGKRGDRLTLTSPFWVEDPFPVISSLQDYINQPDRDLSADLKAIKDRREEKLAKIRETLKTYPQPVVSQFESLLKAAQEAQILREDHGHWIDFPVIYHLRRVVLEFGTRLTDTGIIDSRDDIFYLMPDELRQAAAMLPRKTDFRGRIAERRLTEKRFADYSPPPTLGALPSGAFPDDPLSIAFFKIEGFELPVSEVPDGLSGHPGSGGTVRGRAKVLRSLSDAGKLEPGDIMVAISAGPTWTPLFGSIAGLVTDIGGVLSHSAVLAREYGIPAVVGVSTATSVIQDGQIIEVDGDRGIVRTSLTL
ncbi:MAG: hypothetical protein BWK80_13480 [Desulfobacteraceae bacterium IS3]|nr:MAG: hypothetical protein BWK80_13480 [Desulfobacteraceae bacterium IS3]